MQIRDKTNKRKAIEIVYEEIKTQYLCIGTIRQRQNTCDSKKLVCPRILNVRFFYTTEEETSDNCLGNNFYAYEKRN